MTQPITDPALLKELNAPTGRKPVTDERLLFELENGSPDISLGGARTKQARPRSMPEELARQVGLTARAGAMGVTFPGRAVGDLLGMGSTRAMGRFLDLFLPKPENAVERVAGDVASAMAGAAGQAKLADLVASGASGAGRLIAEKLAEGPGLQIVSGGTGAGAAGVTREMGGSPTAQMVAGLAGGMAPSVGQAVVGGTVRGLLRGGEEGRRRTAENLQTFDDAGTTPTVGQATEARGSRLAETMLGKTPGSAGIMAEKAKAQAAELGGKVEGLADSLTLRSGAAPAGREIKAGVEKFMQDFRTKQTRLYNELDTRIPSQTSVDMTNTVNALKALNADIPNAPELSRFFKNSTIQSIEGAMSSDTAGFTTRLPYEALKKLRTLVGQEIDNTNLASSVPRSKWKALYAALSQDLGEAAKAQGPEAVKAFERANTFTRAGHARIENVLQPVVGKADPEDIFKAAVSGTHEGATTLWGIMRSVPESAQKSVAATVLQRMGKATPGQQNAAGEVFSPETFLTNWNRLAPESKTALFSRYGPDFVKNIDQIAKVAGNLREGSRIFANPSGTEAAVTSRLGVAGIVYGLLFGHPEASAALAGGMAGAHVGAKYLMTNPDFVRWLAQTTTMPKGSEGAALIALEKMAEKQSPRDQAAMRDVAQELRKSVPR